MEENLATRFSAETRCGSRSIHHDGSRRGGEVARSELVSEQQVANQLLAQIAARKQ